MSIFITNHDLLVLVPVDFPESQRWRAGGREWTQQVGTIDGNQRWRSWSRRSQRLLWSKGIFTILYPSHLLINDIISIGHNLFELICNITLSQLNKIVLNKIIMYIQVIMVHKYHSTLLGFFIDVWLHIKYENPLS